jgi:hypothetical protein
LSAIFKAPDAPLIAGTRVSVAGAGSRYGDNDGAARG